MKTFVKILAGIAIVLVLGWGAVMFATGGMVDVADDFFEAARDGDIPLAYTYLSDDFKAGATEDQLADFKRQQDHASEQRRQLGQSFL